MPIKNYTTKVPAVQTVGEIQGILAAHGARKVRMDYAENGRVTAVTFALDCCGSLHGFRLEARPDGVKAVMAKERTKCDDEQAERIAWRNLKDWIAAQVALVETEQATMDELFFPKLVDRNEEVDDGARMDGHERGATACWRESFDYQQMGPCDRWLPRSIRPEGGTALSPGRLGTGRSCEMVDANAGEWMAHAQRAKTTGGARGLDEGLVRSHL